MGLIFGDSTFNRVPLQLRKNCTTQSSCFDSQCIFVNFWSSYVRSSMFWYGRQCVRQRSTYGLHYCNKNRPIRPRQIEIWSYSSRKIHQLTKCIIWANACWIQSAPMCTQHTYSVMNAQNAVEQPVYSARALSKLNTVLHSYTWA